jgi:hypothetical protein
MTIDELKKEIVESVSRTVRSIIEMPIGSQNSYGRGHVDGMIDAYENVLQKLHKITLEK